MSFNILVMESFDTYINNCRDRVFSKENRSYLMGIAIIWIVCLHFYCWFQGKLPWWVYFFSEGQTGVDIFLFLSAYGLEASFRENGWKSFYMNRAKRILPVYSLFLFSIYGIFFNNIPIGNVLKECIAQLTGLALFQKPDFFSANFEYDWFTPALILFYLLFPLISWGLNSLAKKKCTAEIITLIILIIISLFALRYIQGSFKAFLYRLPIFALGASTYIHLENRQTNRLFTLYVIMIVGGFLSNQHWFLSSSFVPASILVYSMVQSQQPFKKMISAIGRHSYEIYLAHIFPVTNFFMLYVFDNIYLFIIATIIWTVIVAFIFSTFHMYINRAINTYIK